MQNRGGTARKAAVASQRLAGPLLLGLAGALFVVMTVSLGFVLTTSRTQFAAVERTQSVLTQTARLEDDLDDSLSALRRYAVLHRPADLSRLDAEKRSTRANLALLNSLAAGDPPTERQSAAISRSTESLLGALERMTGASGTELEAGRQELVRLADRANARLTQLREAKHTELENNLTSAHRSIRDAIWLALFGAVAVPGLGLAGLWLLNRTRSAQRARQLQREMMQAQRLAVMGETAAVLAHDVSHPLTAANNYLGALRRTASAASHDESEKIVELAGRASRQINRASEILLRLRRFIETREAERESSEPSALIEDAMSLIGPVDGEVELRSEIEPGLPSIVVDRVQIQQVMVNLMRNGLEAMQGCPRRQLTVSAAPETHAVIFSIADTGRGLSADRAEHLFRPVASSKRDGMGIGLTICRNIIAEHRGAIWAEANPPGGTIFRFRLPAT